MEPGDRPDLCSIVVFIGFSFLYIEVSLMIACSSLQESENLLSRDRKIANSRLF
jgi:hypothetical protein